MTLNQVEQSSSVPPSTRDLRSFSIAVTFPDAWFTQNFPLRDMAFERELVRKALNSAACATAVPVVTLFHISIVRHSNATYLDSRPAA